MKNRKYEILENDFIMYKGKKLYRIKALRNIDLLVSKGELGGYVGGYHNLSQEGDCWISDKAKVYGNARIENDAKVVGSEVFGNAIVRDCSVIFEYSQVFGNAVVRGNASIHNGAEIFGNARIEDYAEIRGRSKVYDNAVINNSVELFGSAKVSGNSKVKDVAKVYGSARVYGNALVYGFDVIKSNYYHE